MEKCSWEQVVLTRAHLETMLKIQDGANELSIDSKTCFMRGYGNHLASLYKYLLLRNCDPVSVQYVRKIHAVVKRGGCNPLSLPDLPQEDELLVEASEA